MNYVVMCRVSGGFTGVNEAPLKIGGKVAYFPSLEAAEAKAKECRDVPKSPYSLAAYRYWAVLVN